MAVAFSRASLMIRSASRSASAMISAFAARPALAQEIQISIDDSLAAAAGLDAQTV